MKKASTRQKIAEVESSSKTWAYNMEVLRHVATAGSQSPILTPFCPCILAKSVFLPMHCFRGILRSLFELAWLFFSEQMLEAILKRKLHSSD